MAEILISRYENFIENNSITPLTTNLSATEIEKLYGNRLRSRMRNKFNLISNKRNSFDKKLFPNIKDVIKFANSNCALFLGNKSK